MRASAFLLRIAFTSAGTAIGDCPFMPGVGASHLSTSEKASGSAAKVRAAASSFAWAMATLRAFRFSCRSSSGFRGIGVPGPRPPTAGSWMSAKKAAIE